jgi:hypothetical protein
MIISHDGENAGHTQHRLRSWAVTTVNVKQFRVPRRCRFAITAQGFGQDGVLTSENLNHQGTSW